MSSDDVAIRVQGLGKCYQIYETPSDRLKQFVVPRLQRLVGRPAGQYFREFWALRDVSFEVRKGETVGIIGRNGSGKSTLLQIICGTLSPTGGTVETRGRIAALLELGSGFNPEFTGRENVYLNAAVLGLSKDEVDARFDAIAAFADIGEFIEQPVKTYSSGMFARLAFSVAIHVDPDILVVDEALSVGDFGFQFKCFRRIKELSDAGCTILFVAHDIEQVQKLCRHALYLSEGKSIFFGDAKTGCERYLADVWLSVGAEEASPSTKNSHRGQAAIPQNLQADYDGFSKKIDAYRRGKRASGEILHASINGSAFDDQRIIFGEKMDIRIAFRFKETLENPVMAVYVTDQTGQLIVGTNSLIEHVSFSDCVPGREYILGLAFENRLREGRFALQIFLADIVGGMQTDFIDYIEMAVSFQSVAPANVQHWAWVTPSFSVSLMPVDGGCR